MVIVDTTVWIDYFNGVPNSETDYLHRELGRLRFGLTDLILCEILQGIDGERDVTHVLSALGNFDIFDTGGRKLAVATAQNYRRLRSQGQTRPQDHRLPYCNLLHRQSSFALASRS